MTDEQNGVTPEYIETTFRTEAHVEWRTELAFETLHKAAEALREAQAQWDEALLALARSQKAGEELNRLWGRRVDEWIAERDRLAEENRRLRKEVEELEAHIDEPNERM